MYTIFIAINLTIYKYFFPTLLPIFNNTVQQGGVCCRHGAKTTRALCNYTGTDDGFNGFSNGVSSGGRCTNVAKRGGLCRRHGAFDLINCQKAGCKRVARSGDYCDLHTKRMKRRKQRKQEELKEESEEEEEEVKEDPMSYIMPPLPGIGENICPIITQDDVPPEESTTSTLKTDEIKSTPSDLMAVDSTDNDAAAALHALAFLGKSVGNSGKSVEGGENKKGVKSEEEEGNAKSSPLDGAVSGDTTSAPPSLLLSSPARKSIVTSKSTPASVTPNAPVSKLDPPPSNPKLDNRNRSDSAALIASIVDDKPSLSDANLLMDLSPRPTSRPSSPPEKRTPQAMSEANLLMDLNKVG